jgi:hypothetical protein
VRACVRACVHLSVCVYMCVFVCGCGCAGVGVGVGGGVYIHTYIPQPDCRLLSWAACGPWTDAGRCAARGWGALRPQPRLWTTQMLLRLAGPQPASPAGSRGRRGPPARRTPALPLLPPPLSARLPDPVAPAQRRRHRSCTHFDEPVPHRPPEQPRSSPSCPFGRVRGWLQRGCGSPGLPRRAVLPAVRRTCLTGPPAPPARIPWRCAV